MTATYIVIGITALIIGSLLISSISYSRQQAIAKRQQKLSFYKKTTSELSSHVKLLLNVDPSFELICLLQFQIVESLKQACKLAPKDTQLTSHLQNHAKNLNLFLQGQRQTEIVPYVTNDKALAKAQRQLSEVTRFIEIERNKNTLEEDQCNELIEHVAHIRLNIEIESCLHQAELYKAKNDVVMFQLYIKQARDCISKSPLEFEGKHSRIKTLTETLNNVKRTNKIAIEPSE